MLKGKTIVLGVTGSIAAYKMANVASMLVKRGCEVHVVMTKNARQSRCDADRTSFSEYHW